MSGAFPEIVAALGEVLAGRSVGLDGELVAAAPGRAPDFAVLQRRLGTRPSAELLARVPVNYVAFDLTWLDDEPTVRLPYGRRRELLAELGLARHPRLLVPDHHVGVDPALLLELADRHDLEGLIGKRVDSAYRPGRSPAWIKVVLRRRIECVIGAWIPSRTAGSDHLGALLLGRLAPPRPGGRRLRLDSVGAVGTGWSRSQGRRLLERLHPLARTSNPFSTQVPREYRSRARWVQPELVCLIEYRTWTQAGYLRHPSYKGLAEDADPAARAGQPRRRGE